MFVDYFSLNNIVGFIVLVSNEYGSFHFIFFRMIICLPSLWRYTPFWYFFFFCRSIIFFTVFFMFYFSPILASFIENSCFFLADWLWCITSHQHLVKQSYLTTTQRWKVADIHTMTPIKCLEFNHIYSKENLVCKLLKCCRVEYFFFYLSFLIWFGSYELIGYNPFLMVAVQFIHHNDQSFYFICPNFFWHFRPI